MRRIRLALALAVSTLLLSPTLAIAAVVDDPNDTPGKLDIARLSVVRKPSGAVVFTVKFHSRLGNYVLLRSTNKVTTLFDLDGDPEIDLFGGTRGFRGELDPNKVFVSWASESTGDLIVRRPDETTIRWRIPPFFDVFPAGAFRVAVLSSFFRTGRVCDPTCYDFAPAYGQWLTVG